MRIIKKSVGLRCNYLNLIVAPFPVGNYAKGFMVHNENELALLIECKCVVTAPMIINITNELKVISRYYILKVCSFFKYYDFKAKGNVISIHINIGLHKINFIFKRKFIPS